MEPSTTLILSSRQSQRLHGVSALELF
uniref:Uncharacterized protein n=1 Tax=Rhizophora mucronata TaxID=61149 RepID=A0A2P2R2W9_RHIMU